MCFIIVYVYNMCVCVYMGVHVCVCMCVRVCMWCGHVYGCMWVSLYVWMRVEVFRTCSCDQNALTGDSELCSLWTRYIGNSNIDPWDDPEIYTGSCSKDQTAIQIQKKLRHFM